MTTDRVSIPSQPTAPARARKVPEVACPNCGKLLIPCVKEGRLSIFDMDVSAHAKLVYSYLETCVGAGNVCTLRIAGIQTKTSLSRASVVRALAELVEALVLSRSPNITPRGKGSTSYTLLYPASQKVNAIKMAPCEPSLLTTKTKHNALTERSTTTPIITITRARATGFDEFVVAARLHLKVEVTPLALGWAAKEWKVLSPPPAAADAMIALIPEVVAAFDETLTLSRLIRETARAPEIAA